MSFKPIDWLNRATGEVVTEKDGGMQSGLPYRFDLIPPEAQAAYAWVMNYGATVSNDGKGYPRNNWRKISRMQNLNHALFHLNNYMSGTGDHPDEELAHAFVRIGMAIAVQENQNEYPYTRIPDDLAQGPAVIDKERNDTYRAKPHFAVSDLEVDITYPYHPDNTNPF